MKFKVIKEIEAENLEDAYLELANEIEQKMDLHSVVRIESK